MHYPPETTSIMLLARMIATVQQANDPATALHFFMQVIKLIVLCGITGRHIRMVGMDRSAICRVVKVSVHSSVEDICLWMMLG
jgi:hypothetical protein